MQTLSPPATVAPKPTWGSFNKDPWRSQQNQGAVVALESWTENLCHQAVAAMESSVVSKPQSNMEPKNEDLQDEFIFLQK